MTVENTTNKTAKINGTGSKTDFDFSFKIFDEADIEVYVIDSAGTATLQTITTDYTVSINTTSEGGTVTFVTAPASTEQVFIKRVLDLTQGSDLPTESNFPESTVENALDRVTMIAIQLEEKLSRAVLLEDTTDLSDLEFPTPTADKILGWNDAATALENKTLTVTETQYSGTISAGLDASKAASPSTDDIYVATDTKLIYVCFGSSVWTAIYNFANTKGADIASAATTNLASATGNFVHVTGTTTITALGTADSGVMRVVRFAGALTLTHNATSLILPGGANITTASNDIAVFVSEGSGNWRCVSYTKADGKAVVETEVNPAFESDLLHVRDEKSANTAGGTFTASAWQTRVLNTVKTNEITGASLASNQITLPAGTYYIEADAPGYDVAEHKLKLRNITDSSDEIIGTSERSAATGDNTTRSKVAGRFTIADEKVFELQHYADTTKATTGFGIQSNFSVIEVYAEVRIWKVA